MPIWSRLSVTPKPCNPESTKSPRVTNQPECNLETTNMELFFFFEKRIFLFFSFSILLILFFFPFYFSLLRFFSLFFFFLILIFGSGSVFRTNLVLAALSFLELYFSFLFRIFFFLLHPPYDFWFQSRNIETPQQNLAQKNKWNE